MGLLLDIGLAAAGGALRGALHPFAAAGDVTSAQADTIASGVMDLVQGFENAAAHPPTEDVIAAGIRGLLSPMVDAGDLTAPKADEITAAVIDALTLVRNVTTPKAQGPLSTPSTL